MIKTLMLLIIVEVTLYTYYMLHRNINLTIPTNCTFPWIAGVSTFSVLWAPRWIRAEEAHSVWVRLRLHGGHHTSFVRPEDKQDRPSFCCRRCATRTTSTQEVKRRYRRWFLTIQRHQGRSGYLWQDGQVLHVSKVNQTVANETFLFPRGCSLSECFRCLVHDQSGAETQIVAQTTSIHACRCVRHDEANDWLPVTVSQHLTHANCLRGYADDRCRVLNNATTHRLLSKLTARNVVDARAAHDLRNRRLSIAAQNVSSLCVAKTERKRSYTNVWSVRCGCNLTLAMMSEQKTLDRASSFREQCSFLYYWTIV